MRSVRIMMNRWGISRRKLARGVFFFAAILLVGWVVERGVFGALEERAAGKDVGTWTVARSDIALSGVGERPEDGAFVVDQTGGGANTDATLTVATHGRFVGRLVLSLPEHPDYHIDVSFVSSKTGKEVVLKKKLEGTLPKNNVDFLRTWVFVVRDYPESLVIHLRGALGAVSSVTIDNAYHFNFFRWLYIEGVLIVASMFWVLRKSIGRHPEYLFAVIALVAGGLLSLGEPRAYVSWDEFIHYKNVDSLTVKSVIRKSAEDIYTHTSSVPASYIEEEQSIIDRYFDTQKTSTEKRKKFAWSIPSPIAAYHNLGYIPASIGLLVGRILHLPNHVVFVLGRLASVIGYAVVVFFAIRRLVSGKVLMAVIALFPTSIFLASNYSYDPWVTSWILLGMAYFFGALERPNEQMTVREMGIMIGALVIGCGPKAIYFLLFLPFFFLPRSKFVSEKQYRRFLFANALAMLFVLATFLVPFVVQGPGKGDVRGGAGVNASGQVHFIFTHPFEYTVIVGRFMLSYLDPRQADGYMTLFAYLGGTPGFLLLLSLLVWVVVTDRKTRGMEQSGFLLRGSVVATVLATVVLICTALYIVFTPVGYSTIEGVQPRYLLPLLFPFLFIVGGSVRVRKYMSDTYYSMAVLSVSAAVLFFGIWEIVLKWHA